MSTVTDIRINRMELKLADTNDPVAQRTEWSPLRPGGANFRTQGLLGSGDVLVARRTKGWVGFSAVFAGMGLLAVVLGLGGLFTEAGAVAVFPVLFGSGFIAIGGFLLRMIPDFTLDRGRGVYFRGPRFLEGVQPLSAQGRLSSVHAVQLLTEQVSSTRSSGSTSFRSHELNLILEDGARVHVMDHGDEAGVLDAATRIARLLDIPVWRASY